MDVMVITGPTCVTVSETSPKDHLIFLRDHEFLVGNKVHATSSSV